MAAIAPHSNSGPQKLTVVNRRLIRYALVTFVAALFGTVIVRQLINGPTQTQQQRDSQRRDEDRAAQDNADPQALRLTLLDELHKQNERKEQEAAAAAKRAAQTDGANTAAPGTAQPDTGQAAKPVDGGARRLARLRGKDGADEDEDASGIYAWESQNAPGASPVTTAAATFPADAGTPGLPAGYTGQPGIPPGVNPAISAAAAAAAMAAADGRDVGGSPDAASANGAASPGEASVPLTPTPAPSAYWVRQGWILTAVINQSLTTDAPGTFRAQVSSDVYDSITGRHLLIERGTMLQGPVNTDVQAGQSRMLLAVTRMDFPNGAYLNLGKWDISDRAGAGGISADHIDDHFWAQFGSAFGIAAVTALAGHYDNAKNVTINVGGYGGNGGGAASGLSSAAGQALTDTVKAVLQKNQNYKRTLSLEPGDKITIVVGHDLLIPPDIARSQNP